METFEQWWERQAVIVAAKTVKDVAKAAFEAAKAQSRNYVADEEVHPEKITFANGRVVSIADNKEPGVHFGVYLEVGQLPD
jgi:hypothetical protein